VRAANPQNPGPPVALALARSATDAARRVPRRDLIRPVRYRIALPAAAGLLAAVGIIVAPAVGQGSDETLNLAPGVSSAQKVPASTEFGSGGTDVTISGAVTETVGGGRGTFNGATCVQDAFYYDGCSGNWQPAAGIRFGNIGSSSTGPLEPASGPPPFSSSHTYSFTFGTTGRFFFWAFPDGYPDTARNGKYSGGFTVTLHGSVSTPPPTQNTAQVGSLSGTVTVKHADGTSEPLTASTTLKASDELQTGVDSGVVLRFADGAQMPVGEMTQLVVADVLTQGSRQNVTVAIKLGEVSAQLHPTKAYQTDFKVSTPSGTTSVQGSAMRVFYDPASRLEIVATLSDKAYFQRGRKKITIPHGKEIAITPKGISRLARIGRAGARGGIDAERARAEVIAILDRSAAACATTVPAGTGTTVKPAKGGWQVTLAVRGKASGAAIWRVTGATVTPITRVSHTLTRGC
jgi:hypothetical protein